ncbi:hypothetical protein F5X68DRAFT_202570 [Plectosphaerella plurivora]|uniref:NmrA-like domain-containing protein n=1 Tax=Plectosphaerella plurivora TaxID=936078 RepID=A0A9P8VE51_9PEZI|nr:hypothetical protein F5X68DRAFT_202570 [Plectosphaerella plurivora]
MAMQIKNVAIVGATGSAGSKIFQALVASGRFNVTALVRKPDAIQEPRATVNVVDFESADDLVKAMKGQDAVIDVSMAPSPALPLRLIDAAVAAGVTRFIPSEFSVDPANPLVRAIPVFGIKNQVLERLKELASEGKLTYTSISTSAFLDWNLRTGFFKINLKTKTAELLNGGTVVVPWTLLDHVGTATVNVLTNLEQTKNQLVYISTVYKSQKEMLALAQEALGEDGWTVSTIDMEPVYQESLRQMQAGNITFEVIGNMIVYCNSREDLTGKWKKDDNALLGVEQWSDDQVKELIKSIAVE